MIEITIAQVLSSYSSFLYSCLCQFFQANKVSHVYGYQVGAEQVDVLFWTPNEEVTYMLCFADTTILSFDVTDTTVSVMMSGLRLSDDGIHSPVEVGAVYVKGQVIKHGIVADLLDKTLH